MKKRYSHVLFAAVFCVMFAVTGGCAHAEPRIYEPTIHQPGKDVVWVPTSPKLVETMLDLAEVTSSDYLIDLGSGAGGIVIAAAKRGATALGIEYNPDLVEYSRRAAAEAGVTAKATFEKADIFESDFSKATVITMFLLPDLNLRLRPQILDLKPGTRIVANSFDMGDWVPDQTANLPDADDSWNTAYFWIVPAKVDGTWKLENGQINFSQQFQEITGTLTAEGKTTTLVGKLRGASVSFTAGGVEYTGTVNGDTISGTYGKGRSWQAVR